MSSFKMRPRPKKPTEPRPISYEIGDSVTVGYLLECVEKLKLENPDRSDNQIRLQIEHEWHDGYGIYLVAPPVAYRVYEEKLAAYKLDLKAYQSWQKAHPKEIEKEKAKQKKATAKRKLKRIEDRLNKELDAVKAKLEKA
jgi:hypothetical protein